MRKQYDIKKAFSSSVLILALASAMGCGSSAPKTAPTDVPPEAPLQVSMQGMSDLVKRLMPVLVDKQTFESPSQEKQIKKEIQDLQKMAQNVVHSDYKKHADPSFGFLSEGFREEITRSAEAFEQGKKEFARYSLLNMTAYCIECHTRTSSGPAFQSAEFDQALKRLAPLERGEYLLAIRRFDPALQEFMKVLENGSAKAFDFYNYDRAIRYALAITVKFQRDAVKTEQVVDKVLSEPQIPYFLKQAAIQWKDSVKKWKAEKPQTRPSVKKLLPHAQALVRRGLNVENGQADRAGDIDLLRGLSELTQALAMNLKPEERAQALFLTGQAYESVRELSLWSIHENYYETCIATLPHSTWSRRCYKALEESTFLGYTGSAGTNIPQDVREKLAKLRKEAEQPTSTEAKPAQ